MTTIRTIDEHPYVITAQALGEALRARGLSHEDQAGDDALAILSSAGTSVEDLADAPAEDVRDRVALALRIDPSAVRVGQRVQLDARDLYGMYCVALFARWHPGPGILTMFTPTVGPPPAPRDFAFLSQAEQHAYELLADAWNHGCAIEDAIARDLDLQDRVSDGVDRQVDEAGRVDRDSGILDTDQA